MFWFRDLCQKALDDRAQVRSIRVTDRRQGALPGGGREAGGMQSSAWNFRFPVTSLPVPRSPDW